jgi:hypothetical protein
MLSVDIPGYNVELSRTDGLKVVQQPVPPTPLWLKILKAVAILLLIILCIVVLIVCAHLFKKRRAEGTVNGRR